jgi:hypothetical protein
MPRSVQAKVSRYAPRDTSRNRLFGRAVDAIWKDAGKQQDNNEQSTH